MPRTALESSTEYLSARGRAAILKRYRPADDPDRVSAERELAAMRLEARIRDVVDSAPPLSDEQIAYLAGLLRPATGGASDG